VCLRRNQKYPFFVSVPQEKEEKMQYCLVSFTALVLHISGIEI
jgi:hypothetical protein